MEIIFEWDIKKAWSNLQKHQVSFEEAQTIFADPFLVTFPDEFHSKRVFLKSKFTTDKHG